MPLDPANNTAPPVATELPNSNFVPLSILNKPVPVTAPAMSSSPACTSTEPVLLKAALIVVVNPLALAKALITPALLMVLPEPKILFPETSHTPPLSLLNTALASATSPVMVPVLSIVILPPAS